MTAIEKFTAALEQNESYKKMSPAGQIALKEAMIFTAKHEVKTILKKEIPFQNDEQKKDFVNQYTEHNKEAINDKIKQLYKLGYEAIEGMV